MYDGCLPSIGDGKVLVAVAGELLELVVVPTARDEGRGIVFIGIGGKGNVHAITTTLGTEKFVRGCSFIVYFRDYTEQLT